MASSLIPHEMQCTKASAKKADRSSGSGPIGIERKSNRQTRKNDSSSKDSAVLSLSGTTFLHDFEWKNSFLPSFTHSFFVSQEPLNHFKRSSKEILSLVQKAFDVAFPQVRYEVTEKDVILRTVSMS